MVLVDASDESGPEAGGPEKQNRLQGVEQAVAEIGKLHPRTTTRAVECLSALSFTLPNYDQEGKRTTAQTAPETTPRLIAAADLHSELAGYGNRVRSAFEGVRARMKAGVDEENIDEIQTEFNLVKGHIDLLKRAADVFSKMDAILHVFDLFEQARGRFVNPLGHTNSDRLRLPLSPRFQLHSEHGIENIAKQFEQWLERVEPIAPLPKAMQVEALLKPHPFLAEKREIVADRTLLRYCEEGEQWELLPLLPYGDMEGSSPKSPEELLREVKAPEGLEAVLMRNDDVNVLNRLMNFENWGASYLAHIEGQMVKFDGRRLVDYKPQDESSKKPSLILVRFIEAKSSRPSAKSPDGSSLPADKGTQSEGTVDGSAK